MPVSKNTKPEELLNNTMMARRSAADAARKSDRKTPGTRAGTIEDWREGGGKGSGESSSARHNRLRDGS